MRTKEQIDAYVKKTTYGLLSKNAASFVAGARGGSFFYVHAPTPPGSDLIYTVDGQHVYCIALKSLNVSVRIWRNGPYSPITHSTTATIEIACSDVRPTPRFRPAAWRTFNFPIKGSEHTVIWQQDRPCLSLMRHNGIAPPCLDKFDSGLILITIKGVWKEFNDYVVGHAIGR